MIEYKKMIEKNIFELVLKCDFNRVGSVFYV